MCTVLSLGKTSEDSEDIRHKSTYHKEGCKEKVIILLSPQPQPNPCIVHDNVQEKDVSKCTYDQRNENRIDDFIAPLLCLVERAYSFASVIKENAQHQKYDTKPPKQPLVASIQCIGQRRTKRHSAKSKQDDNDRA